MAKKKIVRIKRNKEIRAQFDKIEVMEKELKQFRKQKRAEILAIEQEIVDKEKEFMHECDILDVMIKENNVVIKKRNKLISQGMKRKWEERRNEKEN